MIRARLVPAALVLLSWLLFLAPDGSSGETGQGWIKLFNGKDFSGWKVPAGDNGHWKILPGGVIDYDAKSEAKKDKNLWTEKDYSDFELIMDWKLPQKDAGGCGVLLRASDDNFVKVTASTDAIEVQCKAAAAKEKTTAIKPSEWNRLLFTVKGQHLTVAVNGKVVMRLHGPMRIDGEVPTLVTSGPIVLQSEGAEIFYRDVEFRPIAAIPPEFAAK